MKILLDEHIPGPNTRFVFGQQYECIKSLDHHKCQKILRQIGLLCSALCLA